MARKIWILGGVLVFLTILVIYLWFFGKPGEKRVNPLSKINLDTVSRFVMVNTNGKVELEKKGTGWVMNLPVQDVVDSTIPTDIITALKNFTLGTVVSENAAKHEQFKVDPAQASHVQVFVEGKPEPVLDGYIGKSVNGFENCYFRFEASTPVYLANDLPEYQFRRQPNGFRLTKLLVLPPVDPDEIKVVSEKTNVDLVRSSATWTRKGGTSPIDMNLITPFLNKARDFNATDFGTGQETPEMLGFDKPALRVTITTGGHVAEFIVGKKAPATNPKAPPLRYAQTEGRHTVLIVSDDALGNLLSSIRTIP